MLLDVYFGFQCTDVFFWVIQLMFQ